VIHLENKTPRALSAICLCLAEADLSRVGRLSL